jgi:hypothetical protein
MPYLVMTSLLLSVAAIFVTVGRDYQRRSERDLPVEPAPAGGEIRGLAVEAGPAAGEIIVTEFDLFPGELKHLGDHLDLRGRRFTVRGSDPKFVVALEVEKWRDGKRVDRDVSALKTRTGVVEGSVSLPSSFPNGEKAQALVRTVLSADGAVRGGRCYANTSDIPGNMAQITSVVPQQAYRINDSGIFLGLSQISADRGRGLDLLTISFGMDYEKAPWALVVRLRITRVD